MHHNIRSTVSVHVNHRLAEEEFQPVWEKMLAEDKAGAEAMLKSKGEERMRFGVL